MPRSSTRPPDDAAPPGAAPVDAVLFDFHGTLAQVEDAESCVRAAAARHGVRADGARIREIAAALESTGLADGWAPRTVPPSLADAWRNRDLCPADHRNAYVGIMETADFGIRGLAEAVYQRRVAPKGWVAYPDVVPTLTALRDRGVRVAVVSNIGFDVRPHCAAMGFGHLVDTWVLSYEVGACKPDPAIFRHAYQALDVDPARALMIGDTPADAGAAATGCRSLILPASPPGQVHGLTAVLALARAGSVPAAVTAAAP